MLKTYENVEKTEEIIFLIFFIKTIRFIVADRKCIRGDAPHHPVPGERQEPLTVNVRNLCRL
jgi:hypothetical protein